MHSILDERLLSAARPDGSVAALTLPELLELLSAGDPIEFSAVRPHAMQPWLAFLVQLGALVAHLRGGGGQTQRPASEWRAALVELAGGDEGAWDLVREDVGRPAFMQPPLGPALRAKAAKCDLVESPDASAFDTIFTTRAFDVQPNRLRGCAPEQWVYALVALQTTLGYAGRGHYGVARMAGPFACRSFVGRAPSLRPSARFRRDVDVWLRERGRVAARYGYPARGGHALLWLVPWDGTPEERMEFGDLDPFFIEICKATRLRAEGGGLAAVYATTQASRVKTEAASGAEGGTGDVWGWVRPPQKGKGEAKLLAVRADGWTYRLLSEILFSEAPPAALAEDESDGPLSHLWAWALVRAKGKTFGLHERWVPLPHEVSTRLASDQQRAAMGAEALEMIRLADEARSVLLFAVRALHGGGHPDKVSARDERLSRAGAAFDRLVDEAFFESLWAAAGDPAAGRRAWAGALADMARAELDRQQSRASLPSARAHTTVASAMNCLEGGLRKKILAPLENTP